VSVQLHFPTIRMRYSTIVLILVSLLALPSFFSSQVQVCYSPKTADAQHLDDSIVNINPGIKNGMTLIDTYFPNGGHISCMWVNVSAYEGLWTLITIPHQLSSVVSPTPYADGQIYFRNFGIAYDGKYYWTGVSGDLSAVNFMLYIILLAGLITALIVMPNRHVWKHWFG